MAFITVPLLVTTVVAVQYIKRRRRELASTTAGSTASNRMDTSVVGAAIVLLSLPPSLMGTVLELLPTEMSRSIVTILPELPHISATSVENERQRWLSHFQPPRQNLVGIENEEPRKMAAAMVRLVLEDAS